MRICIVPALALFVLNAYGASLPASPTASTAKSAAPTPNWITDLKQPLPWFTWGADLRVRNEYFHNAMTADPEGPYNEQDYFRFRARLFASLKPLENLSLNARLSTEPRSWNNFASYTAFRGHSGADWTYGIFDQLNIQWKRPADLPLTLTVGRQDLMIGDGWLVMEGTPNDGSWTLFLDSARLTWELPDEHTTVDVIGIVQYAHDDGWIETINNQNRLLTDQDERAAILHIANRALPYANMEAYFIYKHDSRVPEGRFGDDADIYTLGGRMSGLAETHWKYSVEGAVQFGEKLDPNVKVPTVSTQPRDLQGFGLNAKLGYMFKDRLNNQVSLAYEFLSGDNPDTDDDEMFDVLWGRWARWSELYNIYSYVPETRVGQIANLHRFGPSWMISPAKNLDVSLSYNLLFADESVATRAFSQALFPGDGFFRGHFVQTWAKYRFSPYLSGHLWAELVAPGDYYRNDDLMSFLRAEVTLSF